jgi:iodotyrosine deiodinase
VAVSDPERQAPHPGGGRGGGAERSTAGARPRTWLDALQPFGTDEHKPFLETAPWLIAVFGQPHGLRDDGSPR